MEARSRRTPKRKARQVASSPPFMRRSLIGPGIQMAYGNKKRKARPTQTSAISVYNQRKWCRGQRAWRKIRQQAVIGLIPLTVRANVRSRGQATSPRILQNKDSDHNSQIKLRNLVLRLYHPAPERCRKVAYFAIKRQEWASINMTEIYFILE